MLPNNPKLQTLRIWLGGVMGEQYKAHDDIIERISNSIVTNKDLENFSKLIGDLYQIAYHKAIEDNKKQLEQLGYTVELKIKQNED